MFDSLLTVNPDYNGAGTNPEEVNGEAIDNFDTVDGDERDREAQWNHYGRQ